MICINCPIGCTLVISGAGEHMTIAGNQCPLGIKYAKEELTNPTRNFASSIPVAGGDMSMLSVKTNKPISKKRIMDAIKIIKEQKITAPVRVGDVIVPNILDTGVDIVATRNIPKTSKE